MLLMEKRKTIQTRETTKGFFLRLKYVGITGIILVAVMFGIWCLKPHKTTVFLGGTEVSVVIADTQATQEKGLGSREKLEANEGMLFIFTDAKPHSFWMKDMRFPIDIIWFDENYRIIFVKENAAPSSYPLIFIPSAPSPFVLEVPAGFFAYHHLKLGDAFEIRR